MSPRIVIAALLSAVAALALMATGAQANVPIYSLASATSSTQAGAHADTVLEVEVGVRGKTEPVTLPCVCNTMRDLKVNTPAGLIAAPGNVPRCTAAEFAILRCPVDSQLGLAVVAFPASDDPSNGWYHFEPLYNMQAGEDQLALLATPQPLSQTPVYIDVTSRTESDYGLEFKTFGIPSILPPNIITTIFWGVPADPIHDPVRFPFFGTKYRGCGNFGGYNPTPLLLANVNPATDGPCGDGWDAVAANSPVVPFVQNPTACLGPTLFTADVLAYDLETTHAEASFPAMTGCDQLSFDPTLAAKPTTTEADSPSGLDVDLTVPQTLSPTTPTSSAIRASTVTLPAGFTINSNAADGKLACTDAQARFGTREQAQCPEHAKVGTLEVESTQFPSLLRGAMYLGEPLPGDRYRIFWSFDGFGLHVKLAGTVVPDPRTGQLVTTFTDLPQFNFQRFNLHFFGAERGALATPERCGTYRVHAEFTPWAFPAVPKQTSTQFFTIDSGPGGAPCPGGARPFGPTFAGGVSDNTAGKHSAFSVDITRPDGDQLLTGVDVTTPPGFSAVLKGIPYCPESAIAQLSSSLHTGVAELASPSCPAASQVGTVVAGAGAGSRPLHVAGSVYWAGPYKGAPLSLVVVVPAVSGPYDLGNVATRVALNVDPLTAQVTAVSDPLPRILEGIPLRARRILVTLDRPRFALNPTDCDPFRLAARAHGDEGAVAERSTHFQVANCAVLPFRPKLTLRLRGSAKRRAHPALRTVYRGTPGGANLAEAVVAMPKSLLLDNAHIVAPCTRVQFAREACPKGSVIGNAVAETPILDDPLRGTAYLRSSSNPLPDIVVALRGQVDFDLVGRIDQAKAGGLRANFETAPDVPVSRFTLSLLGGDRGLLISSENLCKSPPRASVRLRGQNGKRIARMTEIRTSCGESRRTGKR